MDPFAHEKPIFVALPDRVDAAEALGALLDDRDVRHYQLPPLWFLDKAGIDLPGCLPDEATITRENLGRVWAAIRGVCTKQALDVLVARTWVSVEERVRDYYLQRSALETFAAILKVGKPSVSCEPPKEFVRDRIHENPFEVQYRLPKPAGERDHRTPLEEGSLTVYPFDPAKEEARAEADLGDGGGTVIEAFAYPPAREMHREFLERVASREGWLVVDPLA